MVQSVTGSQLDLTAQPQRRVSRVLDLIGADVQITLQGEDSPVIVTTPFPDDLVAMQSYLPMLADLTTAFDGPTLPPGRINLFEAPREVLLGVPGLMPEVVEQILAMRVSDGYRTDPEMATETWLLTSGMVTLDEMKELSMFLTAGGDVYRAQVVGYFDGGGAASRVEAVIDATTPLPRILFWRDMTHLGRGFPLDMLGAGAP